MICEINYFFKDQWAELEDWESMKAAYNIRWGRSAIDEWLDYLPTVSLPIDYIEEAEKRKALRLQEINGDKRWGLEIGIRYFPEKEAYPPVFINDLFLVSKEVTQRYLVRQRDKFKFLHLFEIILSGNTSLFERKHKKMYKHWLFTNLEEEALIRMYEERGISWSDIETLEKSHNFAELLKYGAQTDSKLIKY
jgi:hypothetical protein